MKPLVCIILALASAPAHAATESMPSMPLAKENRVTTVSSHEDFRRSAGFGASEPEIRAMNLMMIEGGGPQTSGPAKHPSPYVLQAAWSATPVYPGQRALFFVVLDPKTQTPVAGLGLTAELSMSGMEMGTQKIAIQETKPGRYRAELSLPMKGLWNLRIVAEDWETRFGFEVQAGP